MSEEDPTITERIDAVTKMEFKQFRPVLAAPKSVKIELTSQCNYRCGFCANVEATNKGEMDRALFERIIPELVAFGVEELGLFYIGESMMVPWLDEAVAYAKKVGIDYVFLTTNGSLATPEKVEALMKAGLDSLKWSFNNASEAQFYQVTRTSPRFYEKVIQNIRDAYRIRQEGRYATRLYASSIQYTGDQQKQMEAAVERIRPYIDEHYWLPLYSFGAQATEREKRLGFKPGAGNQGRLGNLRDPLPCWAVFKEGHITREGKLSACCFDSSDNWIMADLNEVSFEQGWNSVAYQSLRQKHLEGEVHGTACEECIYGRQQQ